MIKGIFFDVDGTLLDTTEFLYQAFEHSLNYHRAPKTSREEMRKMIGKSLEDCYKEFTSMEEVIHFVQTHREFQSNNLDLSRPFPNTLETLDSLRKKGLAIAAISTRSRPSVIETLEVAEIYPLLDYIVGFEDVTTPKPDPEPVNKALTYFTLKPSEVIMVGDSDVDVMAGKNAETQTVGATYGFHGERIRETNPDHVINDIKEIIDLV